MLRGKLKAIHRLFALGNIYDQMHTCDDPFAGQTVLGSILNGPPAPPRDSPLSSRSPKRPISDPVWKLLLSCWNVVVEDRPDVYRIVRQLESGKLSG